MATAIKINGNLVEPDAQSEGGSQYKADASGSNYILIHVNQILEPGQYAEFDRLKVRLLQYVGVNTYLCYYPPENLQNIRQLAFVEYANVYHPDLVVNHVLKSKCRLIAHPDAVAGTSDASSQPEPEAAAPPLFDVFVMLHQDPERSPELLKQVISTRLSLDPATIETGRDRLQMKVKADDLQYIADLDEVQSIEEVPELVAHNYIARQDIAFVDSKNPAPGVTSVDYDAQGIVVGVSDTGIDRGSKINMHPAFQARVIEILNANNDNPTNADRTGHGTHVCGSIACAGDSSEFGPIKGTAPGAQLVVQSLQNLDGRFKTPIDPAALFGQAYAKGARVHNNSWGSGLAKDPADPSGVRRLQGDYSQLAKDIDTFLNSKRDYFMVYSAGNDGRDAANTDTHATIGDEHIAKNCLTVGACESTRKMDFKPPGGPTYRYNSSGLVTGDKSNITVFSNIGPTKNTAVAPNNNSRNKPDVVAPGSIIYSTRSQFSPLQWHRNRTTGALKSTDYDGIVVDNKFIYDSGTSMSAPLVTGCGAVLRKILLNRIPPGKQITGALIKALIVNGTDDLHAKDPKDAQTRGPKVGPVPDAAQGFGRVNIAASVRNATDHVHCGYYIGAPLAQGAAQRLPIKVPAPPGLLQHPILKVTLCYSDMPGADLVNVLNVKVTDNGTPSAKVQYGNTNNATPDGKNNVQKVIWDDIAVGDWEIVIECATIRLPAVTPTQDYSVAWSVDYMTNNLTTAFVILGAVVGALAAIGLLAAFHVI